MMGNLDPFIYRIEFGKETGRNGAGLINLDENV